jgi:hypothetical protein
MQEEYSRTRTLEQARYHLAKAQSEVEAAQRFLGPISDSEEERAVLRAVANARTCLEDSLESLRASLW